MNQRTIDLIFDWIPFLIFIGLLIFFMLRMRPQREQYMDHMRAQLAETQRTNTLLERIATALEKQRA